MEYSLEKNATFFEPNFHLHFPQKSIGMIFQFYSSSCKRGWLLKVTIRFFAAGFGRADAHISFGAGI